MVDEIIIRSAELKDIPGILDVQKDLLLKNKTLKSAEKEGFLVYPLKEEELKDVINSKKYFLVVVEDGEKVVGYALAYDLNDWRRKKLRWDKHAIVLPKVRTHLLTDKILYLRHVARKSEYSGVGEKLEEKIYSLAKDSGFKYVVAEILEMPILNKKSKEAHEKRGFTKIGQTDCFDGNFWGLYEKELV